MLAQLGLPFTSFVPLVTEEAGPDPNPPALAARNARRKADSAAIKFPDHVIVTADTIVVHEGSILGKPTDWQEARAMLTRLSGQTHEVVTAVCLRQKIAEVTHEFHTTTRVTFYPLTDAFITEYLARIAPLDKAGAYAAQDEQGGLIAALDGPLDNVIGLPLEPLQTSLQKFFPELMNATVRDISRL